MPVCQNNTWIWPLKCTSQLKETMSAVQIWSYHSVDADSELQECCTVLRYKLEVDVLEDVVPLYQLIWFNIPGDLNLYV